MLHQPQRGSSTSRVSRDETRVSMYVTFVRKLNYFVTYPSASYLAITGPRPKDEEWKTAFRENRFSAIRSPSSLIPIRHRECDTNPAVGPISPRRRTRSVRVFLFRIGRINVLIWRKNGSFVRLHPRKNVTDTRPHTIAKSSTRCRLLVSSPFLRVRNRSLAVVTGLVSVQKECVTNLTGKESEASTF